MDGLKIVSSIGYVILFINIIIYIIGFFKNKKAYKFFVFYLFSIGVIQLVMEVYASHRMNNHFLSNYYLFFQFVLVSFFYYHNFRGINDKKSNIIKYTSSAIFVALMIQYLIDPKLYHTFNSIGFLGTASVLIVYSVLYFDELLTKKLYFYYVNIGIFFYLLSSVLIFASAASFVSFGNDMDLLIWEINGVLFIIYQLLITYEWRKNFSLNKIKQD